MKYVVAAFLSIIGLVIFLLLIPAGGKVNIFGGNPEVYIRLFGLSIKVYPKKGKKGGKEDHVKKEAEPDAEKEDKPKAKKPMPKITFDMVMEYISFASQALGSFAKGIYVPDFMLEAKLHNDDPSKTGLIYGGVCAALELAVPKIERIIKVKKRDIRIYPEFVGETDYNLSLTVMAVPLHLIITALVLYIKWKRLNRKYKAVQYEQCK